MTAHSESEYVLDETSIGWDRHIQLLCKYLIENKPARITRYEIDEVVDPFASLREGRIGRHVPDMNGDGRSDSMFCHLIDNLRILHRDSYTDNFPVPKWLIDRYPNESWYWKIHKTDESWEVNYDSEKLQKLNTKSDSELINSLLERVANLERVIFAEVLQVEKTITPSNPWANQ